MIADALIRYRTIALSVILVFQLGQACMQPAKDHKRSKEDYIRAIPGKSDTISVKAAEAGEVLISYSDCHTCHKMYDRSIAPAFMDISLKYPMKQAYISMLGRKVISGGTGVWGTAVMSPHPDLSIEDANKMIIYILSLRHAN